MKVNDVYEKYKHLDKVLSDKFLMCMKDENDEFHIFRVMLYELWQTIKSDMQERGK